MVSGIDDRLHRLWTPPGQTLRGHVNHRTSSHRTNRIVPSSQYHRDHYEAVELSVFRHKPRAGDTDENDSKENDCMRGRDGGGAQPCSAARADHAGGAVQGGRNAVRQVRRPGAGLGGEYNWKPGEGVRSVGDVFNLIVTENGMLAATLTG